MNRRTRSTKSSFHCYLKPGALARLRDSKITTNRSHHIRTMSTTSFNRLASSSTPPVPPSPPTVNHLQIDASPCFSGRLCYGPRFLQRKKLVAARSMSFCYLMPTSPAALEVGDSAAVDVFGADVAVH